MTCPDPAVIALLAGSPSDASPESRQARLRDSISRAPEADLLVLPFMATGGPFWSVMDRAAGFAHGERSPFPSIEAIAPAVKERGIPTLATVYAVVAEGVFFSTGVMIEADGSVGAFYRQEHAVNEAEWHEQLYFQPGINDVPPLIRIRDISIGLLLGGDLWVPEAARMLRLAGANSLLSVSGAPESRHGDLRAIAQARSIENGVPVIWSTRDGVGIKHAAAIAEIEDRSPWHRVTLNATAIQSHLRRGDPLRWRRPRRYGPLVKTWEASAG